MEIKKDNNSVNILMKANCSDECDFCDMAYIEFDKKTLMRYLELRNIAEELRKSHGVQYLPISEGVYWIEGIPDELQELYEEVCDKEYFGVTQIPESFLDSNECRTEHTEAHICYYGVLFKGFIKNTSVEVSTWSLSWEFITECLKNCDPQSVRFIKGDDDITDPA